MLLEYFSVCMSYFSNLKKKVIQVQTLVITNSPQTVRGMNRQEVQVLESTSSMTLNNVHNLQGPPYSERRGCLRGGEEAQ